MAHPRQKNLATQGFSVYRIIAKKFASPSEGAAEGRGVGGGIPPRPSDFSEVGVRIFPEISSDFVQRPEQMIFVKVTHLRQDS